MSKKMKAWRVVATLSALVAASCAQELEGIYPPAASFYFPIDIAVSPEVELQPGVMGSRYAYVLNANFDQLYNAGWVTVVDIEQLVASLEGGGDGRDALIQQLSVPNLGTNVSLNADGTLAMVAGRGRQPLSLVEVFDGGATLFCGDPNSELGLAPEFKLTDCDDAHLIDLRSEQEATARQRVDEVVVPQLNRDDIQDPFRVLFIDPPSGCAEGQTCTGGFCGCGSDADCPPGALCQGGSCTGGCAGCSEDPGGSLVVVGYLTGSFLTVLDLGRDLDGILRLSNPRNVFVGSNIGDLEVMPSPFGLFLAGSSQQNTNASVASTLLTFDLGSYLRTPDLPVTTTGEFVRSVSVANGVGGIEMFDLVFSPDGTRGYAANLDASLQNTFAPDSIVTFDPQLTAEDVGDGLAVCREAVPRFDLLDALSIEGRPQSIEYVSRDAGDLVVAALLEQDTLFFLRPDGAGLRAVGRFDFATQVPFFNPDRVPPGLLDPDAPTAEGPYQIRHVRLGDRDLLLITTFFDHGLLVMDVTAPHPDDFVVLGQVRNPDILAADTRAR